MRGPRGGLARRRPLLEGPRYPAKERAHRRAGDVGEQCLVKDLPGAAERGPVAAREGQFGPFWINRGKAQLGLEAREQPGWPGRLPGEGDDERLVGPLRLTDVHRDNLSEPGWSPWPDPHAGGLPIGRGRRYLRFEP